MRKLRITALVILALALCCSAGAEMPELAPEVTVPPGMREISPYATFSDMPKIKVRLYDGNNNRLDEYIRKDEIHFGTPEEFTDLDGVITFRGNNYRDSAAWGTIGDEPSRMKVEWSKKIGGIDDWTGVGWTGQCSIVRWPAETVEIMNIYKKKKAKIGLTEVIYATLDGNIYFLDLDDGTPTRDPIKIGAPIKGSVSVDPRGWPLLYCGQGIDEVDGKSVKIGTRIFSLIDGSTMLFINGRDKVAIRKWYAFDCAPLIDAKTDTMLQLGENGIFYSVKLNTNYDPVAGKISIAPEMVKYLYASPESTRPGMENSLAVYNHYGFFAENSGLIQCVDLNTMGLIWSFATSDDTDSTIVLEEEADEVALYTACELDKRGNKGYCYIRRLNALTGKEKWRVDVPCKTRGDTNGGAFATPALGKGTLSDYIYIQIARTEDGGTLFCIEKSTGKIQWQRSLVTYGWSSPVCVYADSGKGYVFVASASGWIRLIDGLTGKIACDYELDSNIEASPAVFNDMLVVGTRGRKIYGIKFD